MTLPTLDSLPAPVRHAVVAFVGAGSTVIFEAVRAYHGVISVGLPWHDTLVEAINKGSLAAAAGVGILAVTPLTKQYGAFKGPQPVQTDNGATDLDPPQDDEIPPLDLDAIDD